MRANLLLLLFVSLLPFSTNLMASHLDDSGERVAVVILGDLPAALRAAVLARPAAA